MTGASTLFISIHHGVMYSMYSSFIHSYPLHPLLWQYQGLFYRWWWRGRVRHIDVNSLDLQSTRSGGSIDRSHRLNVSRERSSVDGATGLCGVDTLMGNWANDHGGSMGSNDSRSMSSHNSRSRASQKSRTGSNNSWSCWWPRAHRDGSGPVGSGSSPGSGKHGGIRDGRVGETVTGELRDQRNDRRLHAHGEGQSEDDSDGELGGEEKRSRISSRKR